MIQNIYLNIIPDNPVQPFFVPLSEQYFSLFSDLGRKNNIEIN